MDNFLKKYKWLIVIFIMQFFLVNHFIPLLEVFNDKIIYNNDYPYFYSNFLITSSIFSRFKVNAYIPYFFGGFDIKDSSFINYFAGDKLLILLFVFLPSLTVVMFKLYVFLINFIFPFLMYLSAKNFDFNEKEALIASFVSLIFWSFDGWVRDTNFIGVIHFTFSISITILVTSYLYKYFKKDDRKNLFIAITLSIYSLLIFLPSIVILILPFTILLCTKILRKNKILFLSLLFIIIIIIAFLYPKFENLSKNLIPPTFKIIIYDTGLNAFLGDLNSAYIRISFFFGLIGIYFLSKENSKTKFILFLSLFLFLFFYTYFALFIKTDIIIYTSPRRFIIPLALFLIFPASKLLLNFYNYLNKNKGFLAAFLIILFLLSYFNLSEIKQSADDSYYSFKRDVLSTNLPTKTERLTSWLKSNTNNNSRIMIEDSGYLSGFEYGGLIISVLPFEIQREFIGGPFTTPVIKGKHVQNFYEGNFFGKNISSFSTDDMNLTFNLYNIKWVVAWSDESKIYFDNRPNLVKKLDSIGNFSIYATEVKPNFFVKGNGEIESGFNRIKIKNATQGEIIIKYNYVDELKVKQELKISYESVNISGINLRFIKIYNGNISEFEIYI